jgi:hypothetical protein
MFDFRIFPTSKFFSFLALSWPQHTGIVLNSLSLTLVRIFLTHLLSLSEAVWWIIPARLIWYLEFSVIHFFCVKFPKESCVSPGYFKKDQKLIAFTSFLEFLCHPLGLQTTSFLILSYFMQILNQHNKSFPCFHHDLLECSLFFHPFIFISIPGSLQLSFYFSLMHHLTMRTYGRNASWGDSIVVQTSWNELRLRWLEYQQTV